MTQIIRKALVAAQCFVQNELECREASFLPASDSGDGVYISEARRTLSVIDKALDSIPKPLPRKRAKPRRVSVNRDPKYKAWCRSQRCVICGAMAGDWVVQSAITGNGFNGPPRRAIIDPAHTARTNGMSSKGPDSSCVPLERALHEEYDAGRAAFEKKYGVSMPAIAAAHYARYQAETEKAAA